MQNSLEHLTCISFLNLGGRLVLEVGEAERCVNSKWL